MSERLEEIKNGVKLRKRFDGRIVTVSSQGFDYVRLDGDFEPRHVVTKDKLLSYYSVIKEDDSE